MLRVRQRASDDNWKHIMTKGNAVFETDWFVNSPYSERCADELHKGPPYKTGGGFNVKKNRYVRGLSSSVSLTGAAGRYANGQFTDSYFGSNPQGGGIPLLPDDLSPLEARGGTGWAKFKPGKPKVDLGQFFGEFHRIPTVPVLTTVLRNLAKGKHAKLAKFKDLGGEYLNVKFGWVPFVKTLMDMHKLSKTLCKNLNQLKRDNRRGVRRGGIVDVVTEIDSVRTEGTYLYPGLTNEFYADLQGHRLVTTSDVERYWFSARFKYHILDIGTDEWTNRATQALYGLTPSPALLWELLPWSWLVDWFANVGDVIDNMTENSAENLVADYAFIMGSKIFEINVTETMNLNQVGSTSVSSSHQIEVKQRQRASPYGFGLTSGDLSGSQMAVLAALGVSRSGW